MKRVAGERNERYQTKVEQVETNEFRYLASDSFGPFYFDGSIPLVIQVWWASRTFH